MINLTKAKVDEITSLLDKSGWNKAAEIIRSQYSAVEALKACYDQDKVMIESLHKSLEAACREIAYLRARLEAGQNKNADRYEYLRKQHWSNSKIAVVINPKENVKLGAMCPSEDRLDNLIDGEIAKEQQ